MYCEKLLEWENWPNTIDMADWAFRNISRYRPNHRVISFYPYKFFDVIKTYTDGHINESIEHRHFCRHTQQPGESFDDFLLILRKLVTYP